MAFGVRVGLTISEPAGSPVRARVVRVSLEKLGRPPSAAEPASRPAKLTFHATGFARLRELALSEAKVGSLSGALELDATGRPRFLLDPDATLELEQPLEVGTAEGPRVPRKRRRAFGLAFDRASFPVPLKDGELLFLPDGVVDGCRFLELRVELEVGGTVESTKDVNGVVDTPFTDDAPIPINPSPFRIAIRDHLDQPMPGAPYRLEIDGEIFDEVTDGDGFTQPHDTTSRKGRLRVGDDEFDVTFFEDPEDDEVAEFQSILNALGFRAGELSGTFNRSTEDAIASFQRTADLPISGRLDDETKAALRAKHDLGPLAKGPAATT